MSVIDYEEIVPAGADTWTARKPRRRLQVVTARDLLTGVYEPDALIKRVEQMLPPGETSLDQMEAIAKVLAEPDQQIGMIDAILTDEGQLTAVANMSYRFANIDERGNEQESFDKLVLASSKDGRVQIRRHVWRPEQHGHIMTTKHDHGSNDVTLLDIGDNFSDDVFEEVANGEPFIAYSSNHKGRFVGQEQEIPIRELRLRRTTQRVFTAGSVNRMSNTFIHAATLQPDVLTSTVVVAVKEGKQALVYKREGESSLARTVPVDVVSNFQRLRSAIRSK